MSKNYSKENLKKDNNLNARQGLFEFFNLLLEVDRRNNPHLYGEKNKDQEKND